MIKRSKIEKSHWWVDLDSCDEHFHDMTDENRVCSASIVPFTCPVFLSSNYCHNFGLASVMIAYVTGNSGLILITLKKIGV